MSSDPRTGRPYASSREVLAEAACELFLEQGYDATSVADIATRAGVSRSSFFNYFASKSDVLWSGLDERIAEATARLARGGPEEAEAHVRAVVSRIADDFAPDSLALAIANATVMGLADELEHESALRRSRIGRAVSERLRRGGVSALRSDVLGAAYGGAVLAAVEQWAQDRPGRTSLVGVLARSIDEVATLPAAASGGHTRPLA